MSARPAHGPVVRFWPHMPAAEVASTRIRCLQVIAALRAQGADAALFDARQPPPAVLVLGKRSDAASIAQARALQAAHGVRLVLDLCDNHFWAAQPTERLRDRAALLRAAVLAVDCVVCASPRLAEIVRAECPGVRHIEVVDDSLDPLALQSAAGWRGLQLEAWRLVQRATPGRRLVWFGQATSEFGEAGIADIGRIAPVLAAAHRQNPLTLTVISNRRDIWRRHAPGWGFPSLYLPWKATTFGGLLRRHDIALIPVTLNPFTECKTSNRALTAFAAGLAVASDAMPAYARLSQAIVVDDWASGLPRLMDDAVERARRIEAAAAVIQARHEPAAIARQWQALLAGLVTGATPAVPA